MNEIKKFLEAHKDIYADDVARVMLMGSASTGEGVVLVELKTLNRRTLIFTYYQKCLDGCHTESNAIEHYLEWIPRFEYAEFADLQ